MGTEGPRIPDTYATRKFPVNVMTPFAPFKES